MNRIISLFFLFFLSLQSFTLNAQFRSEKRGIAFGYHHEADLQTVSKSLSWWYNWATEPDNSVRETYENYNMDFVPMLWNERTDTARLKVFLKNHPQVKYILGFNEPNFRTQANMTPAKAAASWPRIEELADEFGLKIVAPAVNYCDQCVDIPGTNSDSSPYAWLDAFFEECPDCRVDYIAVHNYMCYASALQSNIEGYLKYGKKIWLTEFACWDQATITPDMQKSYVLGAIDYLENDTNIFRYSWFTGDRSGKWPFLDIYGSVPGTLTELGNLYLNFYPVHDTAAYYPVPGRIEAESYNAMSGIQLEATADFDGLANVGWFDADDWLQYNVEVPDSGEYFLYIRVAGNAPTSLDVLEDDLSLANFSIPSSGGWQNWQTMEQKLVLNKGKHRLKFYTPTGSLNINWIHFNKSPNHAPELIADEDTTLYQPENAVFLAATGIDEDGDSLTFQWTKSSGKNDITIQTPKDATTEITGFTNGTYTFRVTVSDGIETSYDQVKVMVMNRVGINELDENKVSLFPNPVKDILNIQLTETGTPAHIRIYRLNGSLIYSLDSEDAVPKIDVSTFEKGWYLVSVMHGITNWEASFLKE
ncbi:MAG: carbohydrate-binding protein [Prolixibacteraceae bacterium]|nr:carbohydrate-binding protein [Prolixibacteraceae bacterium]